MKTNVFIGIMIAVVAVLMVAGTFYGGVVGTASQGEQSQQNETSDTAQPEIAPDFTVYNSAGEQVKLSDHIGRPVVLNFWASWCPPCREEMPYFETAHADMGGEVEFMMVNMTDGGRETVEVATNFITEGGYTFPILFDSDTEAAQAYTVLGVPMTMFINAEGELVHTVRGAVTEETLLEGIEIAKQ